MKTERACPECGGVGEKETPHVGFYKNKHVETCWKCNGTGKEREAGE